MKFYDYSPGNGTRYRVFALKIEDPDIASQLNISPGGWLIGMLNFGYKCYAFQPHNFLDMWYVGERFGLDDADAEPMTQLLGQIMQRPVRNPWKQCQSCGLPIHPNQEGVGLCVGCEYKHKLR